MLYTHVVAKNFVAAYFFVAYEKLCYRLLFFAKIFVVAYFFVAHKKLCYKLICFDPPYLNFNTFKIILGLGLQGGGEANHVKK